MAEYIYNRPHYFMMEWFIQYVLHIFISFSSFYLENTSNFFNKIFFFFSKQVWLKDKTTQTSFTNGQPQWKTRFRGSNQSHCKSRFNSTLQVPKPFLVFGCFSENYGWAHKWNLKLSIIHKTCNNTRVKCDPSQNKRWKLS